MVLALGAADGASEQQAARAWNNNSDIWFVFYMLLHMFCYADQLGSSGKQPGNQLTTTSTASSAPAWPRVPGFAYPSSASRVETLDVPSVRLPSPSSTEPSS